LKKNFYSFEKVTQSHIGVIFSWLEESHVKEFWDNSQAHKDDIINFINGRKEPSNYAGGNYTYWIGSIDNKPFCFIMTILEVAGEQRPMIKNDHLSKTGTTYSIDYMIGNSEYFGKGLGSQTLEEFTEFFKANIDQNADTFFIDPDMNNPRARHVYEKAGFQYMGEFMMEGSGVFRGRKTHFLVKKL